MRTFLFLFLLIPCSMVSAQSFYTGTYYGHERTARQYDFRNDGTFALTYFYQDGTEPFLAEGMYSVTNTAGVDSLRLDFAACNHCHTGRYLFFVNHLQDTLAMVRLYNDSLNGAGWQGRIRLESQHHTEFTLAVMPGGEQLVYRTKDVEVNDVVTLTLPGGEEAVIKLKNTGEDAYSPYRIYGLKVDESLQPIVYKIDFPTETGVTFSNTPGKGRGIRYDRIADADGNYINVNTTPARPYAQKPQRELRGLRILLDVTFYVLQIAIEGSINGAMSGSYHSIGGGSHDSHSGGRTRGSR